MSEFMQNRSIFIRLLFIAVPVIIIIRLLFLQVFDIGGYKMAAEGQAIYKKKVYPPRGIVYDRKGSVLMNNTIVYDLVVEPHKIKADFDTLGLCKLINIPTEDFQKNFKRLTIKYGPGVKEITLFKNLSPSAVARLQETVYDFEGVELREHTERNFMFNCGGNIMGYINEINENQLKKDEYADYEKGDYIGITGVEATYEDVLRGVPGYQYLLRDVKQRIQGTYKDGTLDSAAQAGKSLELFIDAKLQKLTETMLANKLGSAVAIDPRTGGILAFASGPSFDPSLLTGPQKGKNISKMFFDATLPLFNRAIKAEYPPGSTFKPLTALVALDEGVIDASYGYNCGGAYYGCGRKIGCTHRGGGHARNLAYAIANSCNSYFCHIFRLTIDAKKHGNTHLGLQRWHNYMNDFGLGHPIGIDIPSENGGHIPDSSYFNKTYNGNWTSCNMSIIGMGQGEVTMTPLQMANSMCIIANRGYYYVPHFVKSIGKDSLHPKLTPYLKKHVVAKIADSAFMFVAAGMEAVVTQGTGKIARIPGVKVCGKTGTSQNQRVVNGKLIKLQNHSMFVAYAPMDTPRIAVAVAIENSGYGATWAGPIASLIIEQYLFDSISTKRKGLLKKMQNAKIIPNYIYILDSLDRLKARERDSIKKLSATQKLKYRALNDSIQFRKDSMAVFNYWNKTLFIKPKTNKPIKP